TIAKRMTPLYYAAACQTDFACPKGRGEAAGWCKDMDLYTEHPDTVEPLPEGQAEQGLDPSARSTLHRAYQTRYQSGP
ncbi:MAG: hypothetical protein WD278_07990, partial [Pirellulales bacterium]